MAAVQAFALDNGRADLALASLMLAQDDGRDPEFSGEMHGTLLRELGKELAAELQSLRRKDGHSPGALAHLGASLGLVAGLLGRAAASLQATAEAATP